MRTWLGRDRRSGLSIIEIMSVAGVVALLMAMGFMLYRSMRVAARVSVAENDLKQIATGMELYFRQFGSYPPQGSDLAQVLRPFVDNPEVFNNPLKEETSPGKTVSDLYQQPTLGTLDRPNSYVTAMVSDNGTTSVILKTGQIIERHDDLRFDPNAPPADILASLNPDVQPGGDPGSQNPPPPQPPEPPSNPPIIASPNDYTEEQPAGVVHTKDCFDAEIKVLAVNLTWDGEPVPVVVSATIAHASSDSQSSPGLGPGMDPTQGISPTALFGGNPVKGGDVEHRVVRKADAFTLSAHAEHQSWGVTYGSSENPGQVECVRNGDLPAAFDPNQPGHIVPGPALAGLIDPRGVVTIGDNQVLFLFELGSVSRQANPSFDLQDLVVLVTLTPAPNPSECQDPPPVVPPPPTFDFTGGDVTTKMCSDVTIKAIGSQFGYADGRLVDVGGSVDMQAGWFPLYNNQPIHGGETFKAASIKAGTKISVKGEILGSYERWLWGRYGYPISYTSNDGSGQVLTLKNGSQPICMKPGFPYQASVAKLLAPYVDPQSGLIKIADNEALYCFDYNPLATKTGIDFNDLVILATATVAEKECVDTPAGPTYLPMPLLSIAATPATPQSTSFSVAVANNATDARDVASNVQINAQITAGSQYCTTVSCVEAALGTIATGGSAQATVTVNTNASWNTAYDQQIQVKVSIINEDNNSANRNQSVTVTIAGPPPPPAPVLAIAAKAVPPGTTSIPLVVTNATSKATDVAKNVTLSAQATAGSPFVSKVSVSPASVGQIDNGKSSSHTLTVTPTASWSTAYGQQIQVVAKIASESNNPTVNNGRSVTVTVNGPTGSSTSGSLNLNPNNSQEQFTLTKPDGSTITRNDLLNNRALTYNGRATCIRFRPKGNGNNNTLTVNGQSYTLRNGTTYIITAYNTTDYSNMTVNLYNANQNGMGQWWLNISGNANLVAQ